jgi:hypothetical protein
VCLPCSDGTRAVSIDAGGQSPGGGRQRCRRTGRRSSVAARSGHRLPARAAVARDPGSGATRAQIDVGELPHFASLGIGRPLWLSGSGRPGDPRVVQAAHPQLPERYAYADDEAASVLVASRFRTGFHRLIPGPWVVLGAPGRGRSELASDCCCSRRRSDHGLSAG